MAVTVWRNYQQSLPNEMEPPDGVRTEYRVWLLLRRMVSCVTVEEAGTAPQTERAITEWLLSLNVDDSGVGLKWHPWVAVVGRGLESSLQEHCGMPTEKAHQLASELVAMSVTFAGGGLGLHARLFCPLPAPVRYEEFYHDSDVYGCVSVGEFRSRCCRRVSCLVRAFGMVDTARMLLRYAPMAAIVAKDAGLCITTVNTLRRVGGARYEAFASPLNSKMLGVSDCRLCGFFGDDVDEPFGSLGDFFRVDFRTLPSAGWVVTPPWIASYLEATAVKILDALLLGAADCWFFVLFPAWRHLGAWQLLDDSDYNLLRIDLAAGSFLQQDSYGEGVSEAASPCSLFVISDDANTKISSVTFLYKLRALLLRSYSPAVVQNSWKRACDRVEKFSRMFTKQPPAC